MRRAFHSMIVATWSLVLISQAFGQRRTLVFRVAHGNATHFSLSCGQADAKSSLNVWLILTSIDGRPPRPHSTVTVMTDSEETDVPINGSRIWDSAGSDFDVSILLDRLRAAHSMTLTYAGGASATFALGGAWLDSLGICGAPGKPQFVAMAALP